MPARLKAPGAASKKEAAACRSHRPQHNSRLKSLLAREQSAENGKHHENHDSDNKTTEQQSKKFAWAKLRHDIVPDYWIEPLLEIHCFSTDWISLTRATSSGCGSISFRCSAKACSLRSSPVTLYGFFAYSPIKRLNFTSGT